MFTVVRYDSIKFLIVKEKMVEARIAVRQIYKHADSDTVAD